ncbi:MAG TPA: hypothetical protein VNW47_07910 [Terriglobales bacterium]|jgi:hypothetical protein|nr:hypothetical protein [Terriglobales bacterium]
MPTTDYSWIVAIGLFVLLWLPWSMVFKGLGELRRTWTGKRQK